MTTEGFNREGEPMRPRGDLDFEVYRRDQMLSDVPGWHWQAYSRDRLLDSGDARTRLGLAVALLRARRRLRRQIARETR